VEKKTDAKGIRVLGTENSEEIGGGEGGAREKKKWKEMVEFTRKRKTRGREKVTKTNRYRGGEKGKGRGGDRTKKEK